MSTEIDVAVLSASFLAVAEHEGELAAALAKYVVLTRHLPHCRNVDLVISTTERGRFLVIEKWDSEADARAHLDSEVMVDMASAVIAMIADKPTIDLWASISAHDLH
jgi:quinol monooxygenase YgiN